MGRGGRQGGGVSQLRKETVIEQESLSERRRPLSEKEHEAILQWQKYGGYTVIHNEARGIRQSAEQNKWANSLRSLLKSAIAKQKPFATTVTVMRYMEDDFESELDGDRSLSFVATTSDLSETSVWARSFGESGKRVVIEIQPGSQGLDMCAMTKTNTYGESEILLPPNTRFTRTGETDNGTPIYEAVTPKEGDTEQPVSPEQNLSAAPYNAINKALGTRTSDQKIEFSDGRQVILDLKVKGDEICVTNLVALPQGTGSGSAVMDALERHADQTGQTIVLEGVIADSYFIERGYVVRGYSTLLPGRKDYQRPPQRY